MEKKIISNSTKRIFKKPTLVLELLVPDLKIDRKEIKLRDRYFISDFFLAAWGLRNTWNNLLLFDFDFQFGDLLLVAFIAETIGKLIEDQAFSPSFNLAPPPPFLPSVNPTGETQED